MSECPNCGSPVDRSSAYQRTTHTTKFICGGLLLHTGGEAKLIETEACGLIRSLREELAEARGLAVSMAHELKCSFTDMDCDGECANAGCVSCYPCKLHVQAKALRSNEHRSNT